MTKPQSAYDNLPPRRQAPLPFVGNRPNVFSKPAQPTENVVAQPAAVSAPKPEAAQSKKIQKKRRSLKKDILDRLSRGVPPGQIVEELHCQPQAVYYHVNRAAGKKSGGGKTIQEKLARFNRKFFCGGDYKMTLDDLGVATNGFRCAFSGRQIDLEKDVFSLSMDDGVPIVYLFEYHLLLKTLRSGRYLENCISFLLAKGYSVEKKIEVSGVTF